MYACLAVTCHLHFWQNDRDFLRATVVTRGWNGYRNKSQHRKSTLEKKILPPFQQGFEPATFQSRVRCSNHWAIPAPLVCIHVLTSSIYSSRTDSAKHSRQTVSKHWTSQGNAHVLTHIHTCTVIQGQIQTSATQHSLLRGWGVGGGLHLRLKTCFQSKQNGLECPVTWQP